MVGKSFLSEVITLCIIKYMTKQRTFFQKAYGLGLNRVPSGYGWPMEIDPQVQLFLDEVKKTVKSGRGLDIGCGQGRHTFLLAENGFEAYGIDFLERPIHDAQERSRQENNTHVHFSVADVLNLSFPENYFDVVIDWSVLDHIYPKDWDKYLINIKKVLKTNGYLILIEFSSEDRRITDIHKNSRDEANYDHFFREDEISNLFGKDFDIIDIVHNELSTTSNFAMINVLLQKK